MVQDIISRYVYIPIIPSQGLVIQLPVCERTSRFQWRKHLADKSAPVKKPQIPIVKPDTKKMVADILRANNFNVPCRRVRVAYSIANDHTQASFQILATILSKCLPCTASSHAAYTSSS